MTNRDDYALALQDAILDVRTNWERYRSDFIRRRP
jgi:hypothetical protein